MISFGYWRDVELYRRPKPSNMLLWMVRESLGESDIHGWRDIWLLELAYRLIWMSQAVLETVQRAEYT